MVTISPILPCTSSITAPRPIPATSPQRNAVRLAARALGQELVPGHRHLRMERWAQHLGRAGKRNTDMESKFDLWRVRPGFGAVYRQVAKTVIRAQKPPANVPPRSFPDADPCWR